MDTKSLARKLVLPVAVLVLACGCGRSTAPRAENSASEFVRVMNTGKNYLDQGEGAKAAEAYQQAVRLVATDPDARLNLANAHLLAGQPAGAIEQAEEALRLDSNLAAAHFVKGSALIRQGKFAEALQSLQTARELDLGEREPALSYQLGLAHAKLGQWEEAIVRFMEVTTDRPDHPTAQYQLSQALLRAGREAEAQQALEAHQQIAAQNAGSIMTEAKLERSKYTQARAPFVLEQPAATGVPVRFVEETATAFGGQAARYSGPVAIVHPNGALALADTNQLVSLGTSLFVLEPGQGFRLLWNSNAVFQARDEPHPAIEGARYAKMLVGDLQNDRFEDVLVLGDQGSHLFKFATNGLAMDAGPFSRLHSLRAVDGVLADLDFTGKLDLLAVTAGTNAVRMFRQFGPLLFTDITKTSGIPAQLTNAARLLVEDWPKDEMMDLIVARPGEAPLLLAKERGGALVATNISGWPAGTVMATGDLNNDLRADLAVAHAGAVEIFFHGTNEKRRIPVADPAVRALVLADYDNDGWLDLWTVGDRVHAWRNQGQAGFAAADDALGLGTLTGPFDTLRFADFDVDGDSDALLTVATGGLRYLRNDGGQANLQLKLRLLGNRSNASGLGVKVEVMSGGLRLVRTVHSLPVEIGVGQNAKIDSLLVHWFNLVAPNIDVPVHPREPLAIFELILPEGSCPYLYAWDGTRFRFVTDLLGAAPLGLPVAEGVMIEADPDEYVLIGQEQNFVPRDGFYEVRITEELREALYLDEAKLVVVDHPTGTEAHPTDKLVPRRPFPPGGITLVRQEKPLLRAETLSGREVTAALQREDGRRVSPEQLRVPQQRGLAERHGVVLDFGPLPAAREGRPLTLLLNGWLRFGGGMANINASHDPSLPFPFPSLEVEIEGEWRSVPITLGAPAGKTKTIVAALPDALPRGAHRLRVQTAFEIHWDRIALFEPADTGAARITRLAPAEADLRWRGFSEFEDLSWDWPLTPDYDRVSPNPKWRITPSGWCTRYGAVGELIARRDEGLLIMNGGDELALKFAVADLPAKPEGYQRQFFLYTDGWDKDSDFHVRAGTTIEPLPWHGQDDQRYGSEPRPSFPSDTLHQRYNTRWVAPQTLQRLARQSR